MLLKPLTSLPILLLALTISRPVTAADNSQTVDLTSYWDSAVSSLLLAAGMYGGVEGNNGQEINLSFSQSQDIIKGYSSELGQLDGQDITLSYDGSSGRLGFSAGYIYTEHQANQEPGTILLGLDTINQRSSSSINNPENPWYFTLNLSKSFQISDTLALGVGSKAMLINKPFGKPDGRAIALSLNLPLSYKDYLTITPELQWSRSLLDDNGQADGNDPDSYNLNEEEDVIYGGMSISFSY